MEREFLTPLPAERFELSELADPRVDAKARIRVRTNCYSVPAAMADRPIALPDTEATEVAHCPRSPRRGPDTTGETPKGPKS